MPRPDFVKTEDLLRWSKIINNTIILDPEILKIPHVRETCYASMWFYEELCKLQCPESIYAKIIFSISKNKKIDYTIDKNDDPWDFYQKTLNKYIDNSLIIDDDFVDFSKLN